MDALAHTLQDFIRDLGYWGLFVLIVLESTAVPVPSLLVMPFAGYLASAGYFSLPAVLAVNSLAAMVGSSLSYAFGAIGGAPLLRKYGKYILVKPDDLDRTHEYFERNGARTVFLARFIPVLRHIISIPAGIARMKFLPFLGLTLAGASLWGGGLIVLGYQLGENWDVIRKWKALDLAIAGVVVVVLVVLAVRFIRTRRAAAHTGGKAGS